MPWTYSQSTGELRHNGVVVATGYSGLAGPTRNNPDAEDQANRGPIPRGRYRIGAPYHNPHTGPHSMDLTPMGHNARGRTAFLIHGDRPDHNASHGCTIFDHRVRVQISQSGDNILDVVR